MVKILNYTPHVITLIKGDVSLEIPSSGVARCQEVKEKIGEVNGFPVYSITYGPVSGLPEPAEDTVIVVSSLNANGAKAAGRTDCLIVTDTVRNDKGQVVGACGLAVV